MSGAALEPPTEWDAHVYHRVSETHLANAGFIDIETGLDHEPTPFADALSFREFVTSAVLRAHLVAIESENLRSAFMTGITAMAASDDPPFVLDNWRLNLSARRPSAS